MRFARTPKRSISSGTTRGWSGRSHHPRRSTTPVDFIGVDGEGITVNGEHRYVLFGIGQDQIEDSNGLDWQSIFDFAYRRHRPRSAYVGFFLGYDFTQIFRTMPENRAWMVLTSEGRALRKHRIAGKAPHPVEQDGWQFDLLGMKRLRIRPKGCDCPVPTCKCKHDPWMYVCDVGSFFQTSLLNVIDPKGWSPGTEVVTPDEFALISEGKRRRSTAVLDENMKTYNRLENDVLARVMRSLDVGFHDIGVHLTASKWFGPGQAAQEWLKGQGVSTRENLSPVVPVWFSEAARMSYYGGWFEQFMHGIIPGDSHEYDINSAYPSIIEGLPCLMHGKYSRGDGLPDAGPNDLCLVYARVWGRGMPDSHGSQHVGTMLHRDANGSILRPMATEGWFWWDELTMAERARLVKRLDNRGKQQVYRWVKYEPCDCPPPMAEIRGLYQKRLDIGKTSPRGKAAKLVYNSDYGKFAQSVGDPIFGNAIYASRITSGCRRQILEAISTHPQGIDAVAMVATDAIYFIGAHPELAISENLGEWDYKLKRNLTLFKPGVYWDDGAREAISRGDSPYFKARGFKATDFMASIGQVDSIFQQWDGQDLRSITWPSVTFKPEFAMVTALQALRRNDWSLAGRVTEGRNAVPLIQNADPFMKREGLYRDEIDGRTIYRSRPHFGMELNQGQLEWIPSHPYVKRFGMDDPWSDEYKGQLGETPDGNVADILAWILTGE